MALRTLVKVGEINNLSDARYCAGMGVDFAGFLLDADSKVSPELFIAITEWIKGVKIVGEFETADSERIEALHERFRFDFVQTSNKELLNTLNVSCAKILKLTINESIEEIESLLPEYDTIVDYFLIESNNTEVISDAEARILDRICKRYPILLGYGLNASDIEKVIDYTNPIGISLKGGDEIRPGYKNFDDLADILEAIELDI